MKRARTVLEINEDGTRALVRALGYADAVRYITSLRPGRGDYTKDRRKLLKDMTTNDILARMESLQSGRGAKKGSDARRKKSA